MSPVVAGGGSGGGGGGGTPGGNDTEVQYNAGGSFGGITGATSDGTNLTFANTALKIKDTDASHVLSVVPGSNLTANRTFSLVTGDANRTLTLAGDLATSGAFNVTFTASGATNVTLPTSGTLVNDAVTTLSSLVSVGTITTGTWSATTIAVNKGGTGQTSYTDGQLLIGNTSGNTLTKATLTAGTGVSITNGGGSITVGASSNQLISEIPIYVTGGGAVLDTGVCFRIRIEFACTITAVTLGADQTGSIVFDIWKDSQANYPPTVADTITASAKPTLSSAITGTDTTLTGWTTSISAGDWLFFNIDSVSTIQSCALILKVTRT